MEEGRARKGATAGEPLLSVRGLTVGFGGKDPALKVVRGVDFDLYPNEVLGIVGESGSGKSVTALSVAGLLPGNARVEGSIRLDGTEVTTASAKRLRRLRAEDVGFIFQDPTTTLNPVQPVGRQIVEGQVYHRRLPARQARARASSSCARSTSPTRRAASASTRTSSRAGCGSGP